MQVSRPNLTFDTSCVLSLLALPGDTTSDRDRAALRELDAWREEGKLEVWVSEKSRTEAEANLKRAHELDPANGQRISKWMQTLTSLGSYRTTAGRWILGVSKLGIDTVEGSEEEGQDYEAMVALLRTTDSFDMAILFEHYVQKNDIFVTRDTKNNMIRLAGQLWDRWRIRVATPPDAVGILQSEYKV